MKGYIGNIEGLALANDNFRQVLFTGEFSQLVIMALRPGEEIGDEVHDVDQFFRFEEGQGRVMIDGEATDVSAGDAAVVPAGSRHNIINASHELPLRLYTIYSPPHHLDATVHRTKAEAEAGE